MTSFKSDYRQLKLVKIKNVQKVYNEILLFERHFSADAKTIFLYMHIYYTFNPTEIFTQLTALCPKLCLLKDKGISNLTVLREKEGNTINI